jgi:hypothetical protein
LKTSNFRSSGFAAVLVASVASSVLGFIIVLMFSAIHPTGKGSWADNLPATIAIVLIWVPVFALIPAGVLALLVERPKARAAIKRGAGGFVQYVSLSLVAAAGLSFLLRVVLHLTNPIYPLVDVFSLGLFSIVGLCSGLSWWYLVVQPGRRA